MPGSIGLAIVAQHLLDPQRGQRLRIAGALFGPGLERFVVQQVRLPERRLEVRLRMRAAQVVTTRPDLADRIHRLRVFVDVDAPGEVMQGAKLIGIHHELLEADYQPALQPAAGVQHEVHARQQPHVQAVRRLVGRLRIRQFRAAERPRTTGTAGSCAAPAAPRP